MSAINGNGGTSGIGEAVANKFLGDDNIVHIASRSTGVDVSDEKQVCAYFESIGAFDHLIITAGSYAPAGKAGEASEIAMAYSLAISNKYMTGSIIDVDGGALVN